ncbi:hypothetical protein [Acetobacter orleanensis]|uniref:Uncharacterized protein n=1 Tax=Acetobacter orleanensis TaxID=104099 RepID=A0A4Y3TK17_9PROT|nr:hypothetical protein [Acetobacter orleanensis]GAN67994.1 hypothetical protein Abol_014_045 [Acetobacter orleanensis JCM 7639]GBR27408.1 hypothetical protein AA0473_1427 [Acetobacter orleanensis NRIC 0473]GEB82084.1 hypothetical protein AOR01nite_05610 [Acetobacter orleanensis]
MMDTQKINDLNHGLCESGTLTDILLIDFKILISSLEVFDTSALQALSPLAQVGIVKRMQMAADIFVDKTSPATVQALADHRSDTVRGIAAFATARLTSTDDVPTLLSAIKPFADDTHFGVREWAWLAVRDKLMASLGDSLIALVP